MDALKDFYIGNARRLGMAGKILFPIPNRRLSKRLYRLTAPTLVLWGAEDRLIPPVYAARWGELLPHATIEIHPGGRTHAALRAPRRLRHRGQPLPRLSPRHGRISIVRTAGSTTRPKARAPR